MFRYLKNVKIFAFDLDGTIYLGDSLIPGAASLIESLRHNYRIAFFTNNSAKSRKEILLKLRRLGISCKLDEIYSCSAMTALYLRESKINDLYVVGSFGLMNELKGEGLRLVAQRYAKNIVVGLDSNFSYNKIESALSVLLRGGKFIACNEDPCYPIGSNKYKPGCAAMVGAIVASSMRRPDFVVGKPNIYILSRIAKSFKVKPEEIAVVGDSYDSDIKMALRFKSMPFLINGRLRYAGKGVIVIKNLRSLAGLIVKASLRSKGGMK